MSKAGKSILRGAKEALAFVKGEGKPKKYRVHVPETVNVKTIRLELNMTQMEFSAQFGIPLATLQNWERGGRLPQEPTRAYLTVIQKDPDAVIEALSHAI